MNAARSTILRKMSRADDVDPAEEKLLSRFGRRFRLGEVLLREAAPADEAFLLRQGRIRLIKQIGATERSLRHLKSGDLFGESALIPGSLHKYTAIALTDGIVLALDSDTLHHLLATAPRLAGKLIVQLLERLHNAEDQIELLLVGDAQSKVVLALLKLLRPEIAQRGDAGSPLELSVSPMELSAMVGLDVDTVKRNVQRLRESGYIQVVGERLAIDDIEALRELYGLLGARDQLIGRQLAPSDRSVSV